MAAQMMLEDALKQMQFYFAARQPLPVGPVKITHYAYVCGLEDL